MGQIFISHAEEDFAIALEIATSLERANFTTWYYERDSVPGPSYLDQVSEAIEQCEAVVLLVSADSLKSHQVDGEVALAWDIRRNLLPIMHGITHKDLEANRRWRIAVGTLPFPRSIRRILIAKELIYCLCSAGQMLG